MTDDEQVVRDRADRAGESSGRDEGNSSGRNGGGSLRGGMKLTAEEEREQKEKMAKKLLEVARVANASDRVVLSNSEINKSDIRSVKVLGEGAFGIVDLVAVDAHAEGILLCVRKKLLKKSEKKNDWLR